MAPLGIWNGLATLEAEAEREQGPPSHVNGFSCHLVVVARRVGALLLERATSCSMRPSRCIRAIDIHWNGSSPTIVAATTTRFRGVFIAPSSSERLLDAPDYGTHPLTDTVEYANVPHGRMELVGSGIRRLAVLLMISCLHVSTINFIVTDDAS